jgi:hypothetical protein
MQSTYQETGEFREKTLNPEGDEVREFYAALEVGWED